MRRVGMYRCGAGLRDSQPDGHRRVHGVHEVPLRHFRLAPLCGPLASIRGSAMPPNPSDDGPKAMPSGRRGESLCCVSWCAGGEGVGPGDDLVEGGVEGVALDVGGLEGGEVLEVGEEGEGDLGADVGHLQFAGDAAQVLHGAGAAGAAVADEADGLVGPLGVQEVDGVLQGAGHGAVVLRGDDDEAVEGRDLLRPGVGVRLGVLAHRRGVGLVEQRELVVEQVDDFEVGVGALGGGLVDPAGDGLAVPSRAGASDDDADLGHGGLFALREQLEHVLASSSGYLPCEVDTRLLDVSSRCESRLFRGRSRGPWGGAPCTVTNWEE